MLDSPYRHRYIQTHTTLYPYEHITKQLSHVLSAFNSQLESHDRQHYKFLQEPLKHPRTPCFYGLPKIHIDFSHLPPVCPIVSQSASLLSPTAQLIDYVLLPIARSYPDYLHNSTTFTHFTRSSCTRRCSFSHYRCNQSLPFHSPNTMP